MTKISNQYSLTNILTADLANSRLGINNVSPTVALDVTGAGKFSSSVTSDDLILTAGTLFSAGNTGFSNRLSDTTLYLQMPATGFNITDNALNTRFILSSAGAATFQSVNAKVNTGQWHLSVQDNTSMAAGVGGGISFNGYKTGTTAQGLYAAIDGYKENATAGNELGGFRIWTSNGTNLVERIRVKSNGNIGIGTSVDVDHKLKVAGIVNSANGASDSVGGGAAYLLDGSATNGSSLTFLQQGVSKFSIWTYDGSNWGNRFSITSGGQTELNNPVTIGKNSNAGSHIAFTENQIYRTGNGILYFQEYSTNHIVALNGGGNLLLGTSTNLGYKIFANGSAGGLSNWNNVSDGRLKKDITPVVNGLDKIKQLNGVYFNWDKEKRSDLSLDDNNHLGLIAQDVEEILPQVVSTSNDEFKTKTIAYSDIVPVLIEAIKELSAKVSLLENK